MDTNIQDSVQPVEAKAVGLNGLGDFSMKDLAIFNQINEQMSKNLGDTLPAMTLYTNDGGGKQAETSKERETRKAPPGEKIESEDLKNSKVNATRTVEDGRQVTNAEYPNGVGVQVKEGPEVETPGGRFEKKPTEARMEISPDHKKVGNSVYDATGKEIIKRNVDGSYTIDSGKGFFRQSPSGIQKVDNLEHDAKGRIVEKKK